MGNHRPRTQGQPPAGARKASYAGAPDPRPGMTEGHAASAPPGSAQASVHVSASRRFRLAPPWSRRGRGRDAGRTGPPKPRRSQGPSALGAARRVSGPRTLRRVPGCCAARALGSRSPLLFRKSCAPRLRGNFGPSCRRRPPPGNRAPRGGRVTYAS